jgi:membrane associated rhomboid family serine protease
MAYLNSDPKWLKKLERLMPWLGVPHLAIILITLQGFGFFLVNSDPLWTGRLALLPEHVLLANEWWRLVTFLALPLSLSPIWMIFSCWFLYSVMNWIESEWGAFKTTFYVLVSVVLTIAFSLSFSYPVGNIQDFNSTLFLAAAALYPEQEISIFGLFCLSYARGRVVGPSLPSCHLFELLPLFWLSVYLSGERLETQARLS